MRKSSFIKVGLASAIAAALSTQVAIADDAMLQDLKTQMSAMQQKIEKLESQQKKSAKSAGKASSSSKSGNKHKVFGQMNITIDNSSAKGPGAEEGTSISSNASRLGMMGSMDTALGDADLIYKAAVQYEGSGENDQTVLFRDAFVGLKSKQKGAVRLGRLTTGYKSSYTKMDPWTDQILQARQSGQQGASNLNANYFNNAI